MPTGSPVPPSPSIAAAAIAGDRSAMHSLWQEHRRWIAAVLLAHKPASAEVDDLLQEVAMTLVAKVNTIRDHSNLRAWLRTVAVNAARAAGRSERHRPQTRAEFDLESPPARAQSNLDIHDHSRQIMQLLAHLPEDYREPLMLKVQGMRSRQIAELLGIQEATVDTRVSRARRMLREMAESLENGSLENGAATNSLSLSGARTKPVQAGASND